MLGEPGRANLLDKIPGILWIFMVLNCSNLRFDRRITGYFIDFDGFEVLASTI